MIKFEDVPCLDIDPELFFPDDTARDQIATAKAICGECHMKSECLEYAIAGRMKYGIFGGMTPSERENVQMNRWRTAYRDRMRAKGISV